MDGRWRKIKTLELKENIGFERLLDDTTALLRVKVCSSRENAHDLYIEDEALRNSASSILGKPIVAKYDRWTRDVKGHEEDEIPIGYVIDNQEPEIIEEESGALSLMVYAILWKEYVPEVFELFVEKSENGDAPIKTVSMEIYLTDVAVDDENNARILAFRYKGVTLLGDDYTPACELAQAEMVAFAKKAEQAEALFSIEMARKNNDIEEKEDEMKSKEKEIFEAPVEAEKEAEMAIPEDDVAMEAPPAGDETKEDETAEEAKEDPKDEADMGCKQDMAVEEPVDYQKKFEDLEKEFAELKCAKEALEVKCSEFESKFAEAAESEKTFAIEQVLMKFEAKLTKEQVADFKERAKAVKPEDTNAFCNEIKAFVADIIVETTEAEFTENKMGILNEQEITNKKSGYELTW